MRATLRIALLVSVVLSGLLAGSRPLLAGTVTFVRPDAHVASGTKPPLGDDVYNTDASGQTMTVKVRRPRTVAFTITVENDGNANDDFDVFGCPAPSPNDGWSVAYLDGTTDISEDMRTGYEVVLAPGGTKDITLRMKIRKEGLKRPRTCRTTLTSTSAPVSDVVGARIRQK